MNYKKLLKSRKFKIAVWGTGYIGLSTMVYFAKKKIKCVGSFLKKYCFSNYRAESNEILQDIIDKKATHVFCCMGRTHGNYKGKEFWSINRCKTSCFIDGGVDRTSIISSAPLSIRAGSYIVKPDATSKREFFEESMVFLGDLYDPKNERVRS